MPRGVAAKVLLPFLCFAVTFHYICMIEKL